MREHRYEQAGDQQAGRTEAGRARAAGTRPARPGTAREDVLHLQRSVGNAAVARLLRSGEPVQRLVDRTQALERVTGSEYKDLKARLDADGGDGMANLYTGQFIRLASLFRKNRDSLNMLKSGSLKHLGALSQYGTQDAFVMTRLHQEVSGFPADKQNRLIDNAVLMDDLSAAVGALSLQSKKHIAVPKHQWDKVVGSPATFQPSDERLDAQLHEPSWEQVAAIMYAAVEHGEQTLYKVSTFQRVHTVGGQQVAVIFAVVNNKPRVSDAWVV